MYTVEALNDLHARTHWSVEKLLDHCAGFSETELARELEGFGYATLLEQLQHVIGAERYWVGVLQGEMLTHEDEADRASVGALRAFRERVVRATRDYLDAATPEELNTAREMTTWGDKQVVLVPARVVIRTQTHVFQHQGQVAAMCRLLGRPVPRGLDFPLV